jgi:hypothetical protein
MEASAICIVDRVLAQAGKRVDDCSERDGALHVGDWGAMEQIIDLRPMGSVFTLCFTGCLFDPRGKH